MSIGAPEIRFRPLGRGTFLGGVLMTLLIHLGLVALVYFGHIKAPIPEEEPRDVMITHMVQLGKPREKFWLPRIVQPPQPKAPEPTIKVTENLEAKPTVKEAPRPEDPKISKALQRALNRARMLEQNEAEEPPEGSLTGSATGTSNEASVGDEYATQIYEAIRKNWVVPTGLSVGDVINQETDIKISIGDDGTILSSTVRKGSGNSLYDDSCIQAVQTTHKVPPPPAAVRARYRRGVLLVFAGKDLAR